jgi:hypothetical protein
MPCPSHLITITIFGEHQYYAVISALCQFFYLRFKYSPQHPEFKNSQSMFFA